MKICAIVCLTAATLIPQAIMAQEYEPYGKSCYAMMRDGTTLSDAVMTRFEGTADAGSFMALSAGALRMAVTQHRTEQCQLMASGQPYDSQCPAGVTMDINDFASELLTSHEEASEAELKAMVQKMSDDYRALAADMNRACQK